MKEVIDEDVNYDYFLPEKAGSGRFYTETRYVKPKIKKAVSNRHIKYKYAQDMAKGIDIEKGCRYYAIVNGSFIFGDFIEALLVEKNYHVKRLSISTLSLSQENVDSIENLIKGNYVDSVDVLVSTYFFSHERNGLVKYMYDTLDIDNKFQLSVARSHTKVVCIETHCGMKIVIHGSANLRSSDNVEQLMIEECEDLHDFNIEHVDALIEKYKTIQKSKPKTKQ